MSSSGVGVVVLHTVNFNRSGNNESLEKPLIAHVKFLDVSKDIHASENFRLKLAAYKKLESLQGSLILK
jgi:hypothetical protein